MTHPPSLSQKSRTPPHAQKRGGRLSNGANCPRHRLQPFIKVIPPRSRDHQSFLGPGHADVEEFHALGGLGFRGFDLAEADEDHGPELKVFNALNG